MNSLKKTLTTLWHDEEGLTIVEYAIAGGLIAAGVIVAFTALGKSVSNVITYIYTTLNANSPAAAG